MRVVSEALLLLLASKDLWLVVQLRFCRQVVDTCQVLQAALRASTFLLLPACSYDPGFQPFEKTTNLRK
jgi:hypothetical protein